jgi:hypothetical protein
MTIPSFLFCSFVISSLILLWVLSQPLHCFKMGMGDYSPGSKWYYAPNKVAPIIFIILFLISGAVHTWQTM